MIDDQTCFCSNAVKVEPGLTPNGHLTASQVVASQLGATTDLINTILLRFLQICTIFLLFITIGVRWFYCSAATHTIAYQVARGGEEKPIGGVATENICLKGRRGCFPLNAANE